MPWARGGWKRKKAAMPPRKVTLGPLTLLQYSLSNFARWVALFAGSATVVIGFLRSVATIMNHRVPLPRDHEKSRRGRTPRVFDRVGLLVDESLGVAEVLFI